MTAKEAVEKYIKPDACLCIGGFGYTRLPMTLVREIIRQHLGGLFVTTCGAAAALEFLAANRLIRYMDTTYIGLEGLQPVALSLRRQIEDREIELIEDYDNYSFCTRVLAARYGWPFAPVMCGLGSDLLEYDSFGDAGLRGRKADGSWIHPSIPPRKHAVIDDPFDGWGCGLTSLMAVIPRPTRQTRLTRFVAQLLTRAEKVSRWYLCHHFCLTSQLFVRRL